MNKDKKINDNRISGIEEVQIGLFTADKNLYYQDTGNIIQDGDIAYRLTIPTAIDEETIYFEDYDNALNYLRDYE